MDPHLVHGYMPNAGFESTRTAVAENLNKRFGSNFTFENIIMTVGAGSSINVIMKTIFDPGDKQVYLLHISLSMQTGLATTMQRQ